GAVQLRQVQGQEALQVRPAGELGGVQRLVAQGQVAEALAAGDGAVLDGEPALGRREQLPAGPLAVGDQVRGPGDGARVHEVAQLLPGALRLRRAGVDAQLVRAEV